MFTGLVHGAGQVTALEPCSEGLRVRVRTGLAEGDREIGASVCVSGVCLTVVGRRGDEIEADVAFETLRKTTLGDLKVGDAVNLEPSLRVGDPLGGHIVSGHIDGVGTVRGVVAHGDAREVWFEVPDELRRFVAPKGSICVDGVSLTVNDVVETGFMAGLVPHTLKVTTLARLETDSRVNLEVDVVARYVARLLDTGSSGGGVTMELLARRGFLGSDHDQGAA